MRKNVQEKQKRMISITNAHNATNNTEHPFHTQGHFTVHVRGGGEKYGAGSARNMRSDSVKLNCFLFVGSRKRTEKKSK